MVTVGILREKESTGEKRAPLTPKDVKWLVNKGINVIVESSRSRIFPDEEYRQAGALVVKKAQKADLLVGIKGPVAEDVVENSGYMVFSHTIKGQKNNMPVLKEFLNKKSYLIDYEKVTDSAGKRLVFFGEFAGICGLVDTLHFYGEKISNKGLKNPFKKIDPAWEYGSLKELNSSLKYAADHIKQEGFSCGPFVLGITGCGNVSKGVHRTIDLLDPIEIPPDQLHDFMKKGDYSNNRIYKVALFKEKKFRRKDEKPFTFNEYLSNPEWFESDLDKYISHFNVLIHTSYWDTPYPRLLPKKMIRRLSQKDDFRLGFIGDISCDINGSVEITYKSTTRDNPVFTYDPNEDKYYDGHKHEGITVLSIDNLPTELPNDASSFFSGVIREYVYQTAASGIMDANVPEEIKRAVITRSGELTENYKYLEEFLN